MLTYILPKYPRRLGTLQYVAPGVDAALLRRWADDVYHPERSGRCSNITLDVVVTSHCCASRENTMGRQRHPSRARASDAREQGATVDR